MSLAILQKPGGYVDETELVVLMRLANEVILYTYKPLCIIFNGNIGSVDYSPNSVCSNHTQIKIPNSFFFHQKYLSFEKIQQMYPNSKLSKKHKYGIINKSKVPVLDEIPQIPPIPAPPRTNNTNTFKSGIFGVLQPPTPPISTGFVFGIPNKDDIPKLGFQKQTFQLSDFELLCDPNVNIIQTIPEKYDMILSNGKLTFKDFYFFEIVEETITIGQTDFYTSTNPNNDLFAKNATFGISFSGTSQEPK